MLRPVGKHSAICLDWYPQLNDLKPTIDGQPRAKNMEKIIQIATSATGSVDTTQENFYCLTQDGKVYMWVRARFPYKKGDKSIIGGKEVEQHETTSDKFYDDEGNSSYWKHGWKELISELEV